MRITFAYLQLTSKVIVSLEAPLGEKNTACVFWEHDCVAHIVV